MVLSSGAPLRNVHLCPTGHTEFSLGKGGPREGYIGMYLSATLGCSFDCSKAPFLVVSWDLLVRGVSSIRLTPYRSCPLSRYFVGFVRA